jgi:hypothetical protein
MVRKSMLGLLVAVMGAAMTLPMAGCEKKSETEKAVDKAADTAKEAGDTAKDAADDLTE